MSFLEGPFHSFLSFGREEWNALLEEDNVFQEYDFLLGLELSGCIGKRDWIPVLFSYREEGKLLAVLPAYIRKDSYGEYIFDFQWAQAFHRAGIPYYPKLTVAVPFTPVQGSRILVHPDLDTTIGAKIGTELLAALLKFGTSEKISSLHLLFCQEKEKDISTNVGFAPRLSHQYHWMNQNFTSFEEYLGGLVKDRRKTIRQERKKIQESGLEILTLTGDAIQKFHIESMFRFYMNTHLKKWGQPYLNLEFFLYLFETLRHRLLLVLAYKEEGIPIAGTFNLFKGTTVYGRYWGASEFVSHLHFECCYYRLMDYAIHHKMSRVEAGAQGEHKFLRGYQAVPMHSAHYIYNESGRRAIFSYLEQEIEMAKENIEAYNANSPIRALREG